MVQLESLVVKRNLINESSENTNFSSKTRGGVIWPEGVETNAVVFVTGAILFCCNSPLHSVVRHMKFQALFYPTKGVGGKRDD